YVLSKEGVGRATEGGMSADDMVGLLERNSGKELPQNVAHSIRDWARLVKRLNVQQVTLLEVDEAVVLDELMSSRKTRKLVLRRLSPTTAIALLPDNDASTRDDPLQRYVRDLRAAGYIPKLSEPDSDTSPGRKNGARVSAAGKSLVGAKSRKSADVGLSVSEEEDHVPPTRTGTS
ncbi:MAG TPA: helicase-associated domain-containing protein, partial [Chloroflexia bacterium]|nr:helicase-associated domain-containing protein [Chloroflexia bacterium]